MTLSDEQLGIIAEHPLDDVLDRFSSRLGLLEETDESWRTVVGSVLLTLLGTTASFNLPAEDGLGNVAEKLFAIQQTVKGGGLKLQHFSALSRAIETKSSDSDIWEVVYGLIHAAKPSTPPTSSIIPTFFGTPIKASSSRLSDSETREIVEQELFFEIRDCTHRNVPGFFEKHFNPAGWDREKKNMLKRLMSHHDGSEWTNFPPDPWEWQVWVWLTALEKDAMPDARYKLHSTRTSNEFKERKGQMDIFFQKPKLGRREVKYKHVLVVGEHKRSEKSADFKSCILQLSRYVRDIFADQPMRRFVHAFTIRGTTMELWVFDRSGAYSSGEFNIHDEPDKVARAIVAYATMDDAAMGLDTSIRLNERHRYVTARNTEEQDIQVELNTLLVRQRAIVCRGTTCFKTRQGVAKLSWRSAKRPSEVKHLTLAQKRGVEGVANVVAHKEFTSIADLRSGLDFSARTQHKFQATIHDRANSRARIKRSDSSGSDRKRKSQDEIARTSKRRSSSPKAVTHRSSDQAKPSLYTSDRSEPYENRILCCLVISPAGRVVSDFNYIEELLEALRDAIKAHRSLYLKGRILHRDISSNNIIITKVKEPGAFKGMLIDLDLAKERESGPSGARHQTGTMQFMAIEVLRGRDHTYRHDLESYFYVLLWMCARSSWTKTELCRGETPPKKSLLRKWEIGSFEDIADAKEGHMMVNGLERIMTEFPGVFDVVKHLCFKIRSILFGDSARLNFGTPAGEPDRLYNAIIDAYNEAIDGCMIDKHK